MTPDPFNLSKDELEKIDFASLDLQAARDRRRQRRTALLFMSPALVLVCGMLLYPVLFNVWISFTNWKKFSGLSSFAGLRQYELLLTNPNFGDAILNTSIWVLASLVLPGAIGLSLAMMMRGQRFEELAKSIFFVPRILAPTSVGVMWFYLYAPEGLLNGILSRILGEPVTFGWLYESSTVTWSVVVAYIWQTVGLSMVLFLIGLSALPRDPLEAATVDGASGWQVFRHVTLPLLLPTILVVVILSVLAGFTVFDHIWVMAKDYPAKRTLSLTVYMYVEAFEKSAWAYASAISVVLGAVVLAVTWTQAVLQDRIERMIR